MPLCKDPAIDYLRGFNFNVVRYPRADLVPLDVLAGHRPPLERLGPLTRVWQTNEPAPQPQALPAGSISGRSSGILKLSLGARLLDNLLSALALQDISASTSLRRARALSFGFPDPTVLGLDPFIVGRYLRSGDLDRANPFVERYITNFGSENATVHIVSEVLRSETLFVSLDVDTKADFEADAAALEGVVEGKLGVSRERSSEQTVVFQGSSLLTFGFKAYEVGYLDGGWDVVGIAPAGDVYLSASSESDAADIEPVIFRDGPLVTIKD